MRTTPSKESDLRTLMSLLSVRTCTTLCLIFFGNLSLANTYAPPPGPYPPAAEHTAAPSKPSSEQSQTEHTRFRGSSVTVVPTKPPVQPAAVASPLTPQAPNVQVRPASRPPAYRFGVPYQGSPYPARRAPQPYYPPGYPAYRPGYPTGYRPALPTAAPRLQAPRATPSVKSAPRPSVVEQAQSAPAAQPGFRDRSALQFRPPELKGTPSQ